MYEKFYRRASQKDWGNIDEQKRKELLKEYNRKLADLQVKLVENYDKKKVRDILEKQKAELDAEYAQIRVP